MRSYQSQSNAADACGFIGFLLVCALVVWAIATAAHWGENGHWEETGRIVPESTIFIPMQVGKDVWMPMPVTTPAHPEKVWIKDPQGSESNGNQQRK